MDLAEIPDVAQRPTGAARVHRGVRGMERRAFLRMTLASAGGASLLLLGRLPTARPAFADHGTDGYQIKAMPCPDYGFYNTNECVPCGPSYIHPNACVTDIGNHHWGYHRRDGCQWSLRKNQCVDGGQADGWIWKITDWCEGCYQPKHRCHDGYNCPGPGGECDFCEKSICKWLIDC